MVQDFQFLQRIDISVDSDNLTISGLNGDADQCYEILLAIKNNSGVNGMNMGMQANAHPIGDTVYNDEHLIGTGSTPLSGRDIGVNRIARNNSDGSWTFVKIKLFAKTGSPRAALASDMNPDAGIVNSHYSWGWMDTVENLTSLKFIYATDDVTPIAAAFGAGSYAVIYKQRMTA